MTAAFSRTTIVAVIAVAAVSLGVAVALMLGGDDLATKVSAGADSYSRSAIGHKGLVELLVRLDIPVIVSRDRSEQKAEHGLLIIAEPTIADPAARTRLADLVGHARCTLVVLPKWYGVVEPGKPWIADASLLPAADARAVLDALELSNTTLVPAALVAGAAPGGWAVEPGRALPDLREPQLIAGDELAPVVAARGGHQLVGGAQGDDSALYVLADPDVLNNFGLRRGDNARFVVELIEQLRADGPVVIDETLHGYAQAPSLVRTLLEPPFVLTTLQLLVCAVLVVWAASVRFGPRRAAPPPIAPGKDFLIRNTAALLAYGGHHAHALDRYLQLTVAAVRQALHAPALAPAAASAWLERVRVTRGGKISLVALEQAVAAADTPARVVEVADQVFCWRMEMTHGTDSRS
jgi:hypothetical protein